MQIAIVGGGISGLTTYLLLEKHLRPAFSRSEDLTIRVYESHRPADYQGELSQGAAFGVGPNGMEAFERLDPSLAVDIKKAGFPCASITMKSAGGYTLGRIPMGYDGQDCVMISRHAVMELLRSRIPEDAVLYKSIASAVEASAGQPATLTFSDGTVESAHLIIGADGVRSTVRKAFLPSKYDAYYEGLYGVGNFLDLSVLTSPASAKGCVMTFSGSGFFAYSPLDGDSRGIWWSSFSRPDPDVRSVDGKEITASLMRRHGKWADPTVRQILATVEEAGPGFKIATWVMPKAPTWVGQDIVLVGDAAHALPSTSGQGISQALEDAEALSLLLAYHVKRHHETNSNSDSKPDLQLALQQYILVRKERVEKILDAALRMGNFKKDMHPLAEMLMYGFLWLIFHLAPGVNMKAIKTYSVEREVQEVVRSGSVSTRR